MKKFFFLKVNILDQLPRTFFVACLFLLVSLLLKNPFSERNLIPNLEPYPDTLHYINPAINFLEGKGMYLQREGRTLKPSVPPLYSIFLMPAFLINNDARMFFFINIILSLSSFYLFYLFLKKIITNNLVLGFLLFLYVTNYFIYWYPTLAMAENLTLLLSMASLLLLVLRVDFKKIIIVSGVAIGLYATKYASIQLALSLLLVYGIKIYIETKGKRDNIRNLSYLIIASSIFLSMHFIYEYAIRGVNQFYIISSLLAPLIPKQVLFENSQPNLSSTPGWFSFFYFKDNFFAYLGALTGKPLRFLWDMTPMVPSYVGILSFFGILLGLLDQKFRLVCFEMFLFLVTSILFLSTFYTVDGRYIYQAIPIQIACFGLFLNIIYSKLNSNFLKKLFYITLLGLFLFYFFSSFMRIKYQLVLNLKYAETPWYYISVLKVNDYFERIPQLDKKPIVISSMPAYYIDFYSNGKYSLLPMDKDQEFREKFESVYGKENDYSDLIRLYEIKLKKGHPLYISKYGLGNETYLKDTFTRVLNHFKNEEVMRDCYETCNLYKLDLKENADRL